MKEKYRRQDQAAQARCLTLVANICGLSTTWYIQDAVEARTGPTAPTAMTSPNEVIAHTSPAHFQALNPYGTHPIDVTALLGPGVRLPLRPRRPL